MSSKRYVRRIQYNPEISTTIEYSLEDGQIFVKIVDSELDILCDFIEIDDALVFLGQLIDRLEQLYNRLQDDRDAIKTMLELEEE